MNPDGTEASFLALAEESLASLFFTTLEAAMAVVSFVRACKSNEIDERSSEKRATAPLQHNLGALAKEMPMKRQKPGELDLERNQQIREVYVCAKPKKNSRLTSAFFKHLPP